jgi:hypothetical protein
MVCVSEEKYKLKLSSFEDTRRKIWGIEKITYEVCRILGSHSGGHEDFYLFGYNDVQSVESQPTSRRNKNSFHSGFLLDLLLDLEDRSDMFLRNV